MSSNYVKVTMPNWPCPNGRSTSTLLIGYLNSKKLPLPLFKGNAFLCALDTTPPIPSPFLSSFPCLLQALFPSMFSFLVDWLGVAGVSCS